MFGIGMPEMLLILAVALILIGPKKLPDLAKSMGRALGEFKRATSDLKETIEMETGMDEVRDNLNTVKDDLQSSVSLDDDTATPVSKTNGQAKATEEPMEQLKDAFDDLNKPTDSKGDTGAEKLDAVTEPEPDVDTDADLDEDDDAMGEDHLPEDKPTP